MGLHHGQANFVTYGKPSLFLDFANKKSLTDRISGNNLIDFTRSSTGTYVGADGLIKYASADEPRFDHNPSTGESLGLLIEESRTNLFSDSRPQNILTGSNAIVTLNADISPNGLTEAYKFQHNPDSTTSEGVNQRRTGSISFTSNTVVLSCWAKGGGGHNYFIWSFQNMGGEIVRTGFRLEGDGETSIITNGNGGHTLQIEKFPNGWYRCVIIGNAQSSGTTTQFLYTSSSYNERTFVEGGYTMLWGMQYEVGSFPTSYIPTSGSTVTRSADTAQITGTNFSNIYNSSEGTLYLEAIGKGIGNTGSNATFQIDDGTSSNRITLINDDQSATNSLITVSGTQTNLTTSPSFTTGVNKNAIAYKSGDNANSLNGSTVVTNSSIVTLPIVDRFRLGSNANGNSNNTIKRAIYYPSRLTNAQLQSLTG